MWTPKEIKKDEAIAMYEEQRNAIIWIKETKGYKEIMKYFEREKEAVGVNLTTCTKENLQYFQARYNSASWFLTFLENISK